jgi:hypothetical protein
MIQDASGREILVHLLELTPEPPQTGDIGPADAERLLAVFEVILAARADVIASIVPPLALTDADRPLLAELEHRQLLWQEALAHALRTVGEQRCANSHLRAYAQPG